MYQTEWVDFTIEDLSFDEEYHFTKEIFEELVKDKFVAVELDEQHQRPLYIWTEKMAFQVIRYQRMLNQQFMIGVPRNPDWRE